MDCYENLGTIGEGTYGVVLKCRHKETGQIVAIKKFKESDEDEQVRKTAIREIRVLKQLRHDNIINLIDVFRNKNKLYLVFEYIETTILGKLEKYPYGIPEENIKRYFFQLMKGVEYCHFHNIIHRDIKPENLLVSKGGALKLCDFGFARTIEGPNARYTDYVSTRWYRAPELLVGDREYGKPVDIWAVGCMFAEVVNGMPLFPGDSDIDQLFHIINCFGRLSERQIEIFKQNPMFSGVELPQPQDHELQTLEKKFPTIDKDALDLMKLCLHYEPEKRGTYQDLLNHPYFAGIEEWYNKELRGILEKDNISGIWPQKKVYNVQKGNTNNRKKEIPKKFKLSFEYINNLNNGPIPSNGETDTYDDDSNALPNIHIQRIVALPYSTGDPPTTRRDEVCIPPISSQQFNSNIGCLNILNAQINEELSAGQLHMFANPSFGSLPTINDFKYIKNNSKKKKFYVNNNPNNPGTNIQKGITKREQNIHPATPMKSTRGQNSNNVNTSVIVGDTGSLLNNNNTSRLPSRGSPSEQLFTFSNKNFNNFGKLNNNNNSKRLMTKIL